VKSIVDALGRLDGVQKAKEDGAKTEYLVKVVETKFHLPSKIRETVPDQYGIDSMKYVLAGEVEKKDGAWFFTHRGSKTVLKLKEGDCDDLKKLLADGKTKLTATGEITEAEKDAKDKMATLAVSEAKETAEKEKK
jgi:hypothetical protein